MDFITNTSHSICLTGILRLIDTIRLDLKDITWTNVGPAVWNMVESEIGFVAANLPLMGPLFGKLRSRAEILLHAYGSSGKEDGVRASKSHSGTSHQKGFVRIGDRGHGMISSPISHGQSTFEDLELDSLPIQGIKVTNNLEQHSVAADTVVSSKDRDFAT